VSKPKKKSTLARREPRSARVSPLLTQLLEAAEAHGENSEPDTEIGDLHQILFASWALLSPSDHQRIYDQFRELVDTELDEQVAFGRGQRSEREVR
jgi:hypothetical protein